MCPMNGSGRDLKGLKSDLGNKEEEKEVGKKGTPSESWEGKKEVTFKLL